MAEVCALLSAILVIIGIGPVSECVIGVDAHSCSHGEAISVSSFEEHVSTLHADGDYLLSQEYEVKLLHLSINDRIYFLLYVMYQLPREQQCQLEGHLAKIAPVCQ